MQRLFFAIGAVSAAIAVLLGSFAAHALKGRLAPEQLAVFETGARYQLIHGLGLVLLGQRPDRPGTSWGGWLLVAGTVIFSGSLYALALSGVRLWGAVTPVGGVCFLAGWALLARAWWPSR